MPVKAIFEAFKQKLEDQEKFVNIKRAIETRRNNNETLIVISLKNFKAITKERQNFGRFQIEQQRFNDFFKKLQEIGAKLVFFCEGPENCRDLKTVIKKKTSYSNRAKRIIDESRDTFKVFSNIGFSTYWIEDIACKYGQVRMGREESYYREVASFATKNNAFAVIAQCSDLLVYPGRWRLWNANELNLEKLTSKEYRKYEFYKDLGMNYSQMALFATLLGNPSYLSKETLSKFKPREKVDDLAAYVKRFQMPLQENEINQILLDIRAGENWSSNIEFNELRDMLRKSIRTYSLIENDKYMDEVDYSLWARKAFVAIHILNRMPIWKTIFYFDPAEIDAITITKDLLCKFAGVLHYNTQSNKGLLNSEMYFFEKEEPVNCEPVYPKGGLLVPKLFDLYSGRVRNSEDVKFKLLSWIVSDALNYEILKKFDKKFLCAALTIHKIMTNGIIQINEADLVMLTVKKAENNSITKVELKGVVNKRAVEIACIFSRIFYFIRDIIKTLGLDDVQVLPKFDCYHFNELFIQMDLMTPNQTQNLFKDIQDLRIYNI